MTLADLPRVMPRLPPDVMQDALRAYIAKLKGAARDNQA